jgi:hypothetical protein
LGTPKFFLKLLPATARRVFEKNENCHCCPPKAIEGPEFL